MSDIALPQPHEHHFAEALSALFWLAAVTLVQHVRALCLRLDTGIIPVVSTRAENESVFDFLRGRYEFINEHASTATIECFVVWGATVDAITRIHAGRLKRTMTKNRQCFVRGLLDLAPGHDLSNIAVPLLSHDISMSFGSAHDAEPFLVEYRKAVANSRIWQTSEDSTQLESVRDFENRTAAARQIVQKNSYAEILYEEYRCCAVHGLELGRKTFCPRDGIQAPHYGNYIYASNDRRLPKHRYRTRIVFPLAYLARLLDEMISNEESECNRDNWIIPDYPTLI